MSANRTTPGQRLSTPDVQAKSTTKGKPGPSGTPKEHMNELIKILVALSTQAKAVADGRVAKKAIRKAIDDNKASLREHLKKVGKAGFAAWVKEHGIHAVVASAVRAAVWPSKPRKFPIDARLSKALEGVVPANHADAVAFLRSLSTWVKKNRPEADDEQE